MKQGMAILTTFGIFVLMIIGARTIHPNLPILVIIGTSIWAGFDASKIALHKYKVNVTTSTALTVVGCLLLWIVVFPWYLVNKGKIKSGEAQLKDEFIGQDSQKVRHQIKGESLEQLEKLAQLRDKGVLTDEEFQAQKSKLLS